MRAQTDDEWLDQLARSACQYFLDEVDPNTGLVHDKSQPDSPASIAGSGFALTIYPIAAKRGYITHADAVEYTRRTLRFLWNAPQGDAPHAIGTHGFFYHFLDPASGHRAWKSEVSTIDSTILFAGALFAAMYFEGPAAAEREIRELGNALYERANWHWAFNSGPNVSLGWRPERGFLKYRWGGYTEALLLYILGLGSPSHPLPASSYAHWCASYRWKRLYGHELLYAGPLFIHQLSHSWIDFRGIQDDYMREHNSDYFENSRRATYVQQAYAIRNPRDLAEYGAHCWGVTASDGPGPTWRTIGEHKRFFYNYHARGVPYGPDDGTVSPWGVVASLPFAPEIVLPTIKAIDNRFSEIVRQYGYAGSFNPTFLASQGAGATWVSPDHYAINQGPVILMIENYRSGLVWRLMRHCPYIVTGLQRAGFRGGWLDTAAAP